MKGWIGIGGVSRGVRASLSLLLLTLGACGQKPAASVKVEATRLGEAFSARDTNPLVTTALAAIRADDYATGVIALQGVRRTPGMTAEQLMASQRTMEAMTADLLARAERGDAKARADLALIERSRSQ